MKKDKSDNTKKKHKDNPAKDEPFSIIFPKEFEAENERRIDDNHGVIEKYFYLTNLIFYFFMPSSILFSNQFTW